MKKITEEQTKRREDGIKKVRNIKVRNIKLDDAAGLRVVSGSS